MPKVTISVGERVIEVEVKDIETLVLTADATFDKAVEKLKAVRDDVDERRVQQLFRIHNAFLDASRSENIKK